MTDTPTPDLEESSSVAVSECFEILSLRRRRTILTCLAEQPDDAIGFQALVDTVATREASAGVEPTTRSQGQTPRRQRVAVSLHHEDLPRLAEAGLIDYDRWRGDVQYNRDDRIDDWLARATEDSESRQGCDREHHSPKP